jgi:hypothetical protein
MYVHNACIYVSMYVCMHETQDDVLDVTGRSLCMCVFNVCMHVCLYVCMYACINACMHVYMHACNFFHEGIRT